MFFSAKARFKNRYNQSVEQMKKKISHKSITEPESVFSKVESIYGLDWTTYHILFLGTIHLFGVYYHYLWLTGKVPWKTVLFGK